MNSVPTPNRRSHLRTALAANSGPLSLRRYFGRPRMANSSSSTEMTFGPVKLRPTSIVRHSRVNSSTTVKSFTCPPRSVRSDTKS